MSAGDLNCRVTINQLVGGFDAANQPVETWTPLATVWASVQYLNGLAAIKADAQVNPRRASIRMRRRTDVTATMQVVHGSTTFRILAVLPDEVDREWLDLACESLS